MSAKPPSVRILARCKADPRSPLTDQGLGADLFELWAALRRIREMDPGSCQGRALLELEKGGFREPARR